MTHQNDRPWMTALEMQFAALRSMADFRPDGTRRAPETFPEWQRLTRDTIKHAECFSWNTETTTALAFAARSVPLNSTINRSDLPCAIGWWWFEKQIEPFVGINKSRVAGLMWGPDGDNIGVWAYVQDVQGYLTGDPLPAFDFSIGPNETLAALGLRQTDIGTRLRQAREGPSVDIGRLLIAGCAWLKQRVVLWSGGHIERHRRKQLAREHNVPLPSDVKVIHLRRTESQHHAPNEHGEAVDWSCRWIVNGHWRNQPYKDERKLIYILPYVKGPDDKPLKVPTHTVYQVNR